MDLLEVALAVILWLVFAFLGWRKKASRRQEAVPTAEWIEVEPEPEAAQPRKRPSEHLPTDFRDLIRQLREGWLPPQDDEPEVREARPEESEAAIPPPPEPDREPPPLERLERPPGMRPRRRSDLAAGLLRDLSSGRTSLARAILLREVLGPPVGLRDEPDLPSSR